MNHQIPKKNWNSEIWKKNWSPLTLLTPGYSTSPVLREGGYKITATLARFSHGKRGRRLQWPQAHSECAVGLALAQSCSNTCSPPKIPSPSCCEMLAFVSPSQASFFSPIFTHHILKEGEQKENNTTLALLWTTKVKP